MECRERAREAGERERERDERERDEIIVLSISQLRCYDRIWSSIEPRESTHVTAVRISDLLKKLQGLCYH